VAVWTLKRECVGDATIKICQVRGRMKTSVFWVVEPCSLVEVYRRFRRACCFRRQCDETSVNFYLTTRCYNPHDVRLHIAAGRTSDPTNGSFFICSVHMSTKFQHTEETHVSPSARPCIFMFLLPSQWMVSAPDLYSGSPGFKNLPGEWLNWPRVFMLVQSHSR
jgi:hypothetical protein